MFPILIRTGYVSPCTIIGAGDILSGPASVSATCSLHLTVSHLVDACTVWLTKRVAHVLSPGVWVTWNTTLGASAV